MIFIPWMRPGEDSISPNAWCQGGAAGGPISNATIFTSRPPVITL